MTLFWTPSPIQEESGHLRPLWYISPVLGKKSQMTTGHNRHPGESLRWDLVRGWEEKEEIPWCVVGVKPRSPKWTEAVFALHKHRMPSLRTLTDTNIARPALGATI